MVEYDLAWLNSGLATAYQRAPNPRVLAADKPHDDDNDDDDDRTLLVDLRKYIRPDLTQVSMSCINELTSVPESFVLLSGTEIISGIINIRITCGHRSVSHSHRHGRNENRYAAWGNSCGIAAEM